MNDDKYEVYKSRRHSSVSSVLHLIAAFIVGFFLGAAYIVRTYLDR